MDVVGALDVWGGCGFNGWDGKYLFTMSDYHHVVATRMIELVCIRTVLTTRTRIFVAKHPYLSVMGSSMHRHPTTQKSRYMIIYYLVGTET